jgi:hypothetical protein
MDSDRSGQPARSGRAARSGTSARTARTARTARSDRSERSERSDWGVARLDAHTREIGRQGVAEVRRVLTETIRAAAERAEAAQASGGEHAGQEAA